MASRSVGLHVGTARQGVRGDSRSKETSSERAKKRARQWSTRRRKKRVEPQWHILRVAEGKEEEALKNAEVAARKAGEDDVEGALPEELPAGYVALRVRAKPRVVEVVTAARCVLTMVEGSGSGWSAEGGAPRPPGSDPGAKGISKGGRTLERRARKLRSDAIRDGEPMTLKEARKKAAEELQEEAMSEDASARQGFSSLREIFQQGAGAQSSSRSQSKVKRSYDADKQAPFSNNDDPETIKPILEERLKEFEELQREEEQKSEGSVLGRRRPINLGSISQSPDNDIEYRKQSPSKPTMPAPDVPAEKTTLRIGDNVKILRGEGRGLFGDIAGINPDGSASVVAREPNFGTEIELELDPSALRKVKPGEKGRKGKKKKGQRGRPKDS